MSSTRFMNFSNRPPDFLGAALTGIMILIPIATALGLRYVGPWPIILLLLGVIAARVLLPRAMPVPAAMTACLIAVAIAVLAVSSVSPDLAARLYPVFMSATMFVAFAATLMRPPSMIERFARLLEPDLDERGVTYTRRVTMVWVAFFTFNGLVAFWTVLNGDLYWWGLYNGLVSYLLAGALFAVEFAVRQYVRSRSDGA